MYRQIKVLNGQMHAYKNTQSKRGGFGAAAGAKTIFVFSAVEPAMFHLQLCILLIAAHTRSHTQTQCSDLKMTVNNCLQKQRSVSYVKCISEMDTRRLRNTQGVNSSLTHF